MKNARLIPLALAAAAALAAAGCGHQAELAEADATPVKARLARVEKTMEARSIEVYGLVQPARQSVVSGRVSGPVVARRVAAGDTVRQGQILLEIQPEMIDGQVSQARGALGQAQAGLSLAEKNLRRYEALHAEKAASALELDMAQMQHEQARGAVEQAQGAVQSASTVAKEATIRAPFASRVVETLVEVGDLAAPGRPLVRLESTAGQELWLFVRQADVGRVTVGQSLALRLDSMPAGETVPGTVQEIAPAADPATHTFTVKVALEAAGAASGSSGRGYLPGDPLERLVAPAAAIHRTGGLELAAIRGSDGKARTRAVTTGRTLDGGRVEILSGLAAGEELLLGLAAPPADGTPVEVLR